MEQIWESNNKELSLNVAINCKGKCVFQVVASDDKPFSQYVNRKITVDNFREITLSFPVTPKKLKIQVECIRGSQNSNDFIVNIVEKPLKKYNIKIDTDTQNFLDLAVYFSQVAGFQKSNENGKLYRTENKMYNIKYYPKIIDFATGNVLNTPARIGHKTGIIEVAQVSMLKYTIPMRMIILLHEFSHKYKNPLMNLPISDEIGADLNALYLYLGCGFSKVDAIFVFANVFLKAQTQSNLERMNKIMEYIKKFENEEYANVIL